MKGNFIPELLKRLETCKGDDDEDERYLDEVLAMASKRRRIDTNANAGKNNGVESERTTELDRVSTPNAKFAVRPEGKMSTSDIDQLASDRHWRPVVEEEPSPLDELVLKGISAQLEPLTRIRLLLACLRFTDSPSPPALVNRLHIEEEVDGDEPMVTCSCDFLAACTCTVRIKIAVRRHRRGQTERITATVRRSDRTAVFASIVRRLGGRFRLLRIDRCANLAATIAAIVDGAAQSGRSIACRRLRLPAGQCCLVAYRLLDACAESLTFLKCALTGENPSTSPRVSPPPPASPATSPEPRFIAAVKRCRQLKNATILNLSAGQPGVLVKRETVQGILSVLPRTGRLTIERPSLCGDFDQYGPMINYWLDLSAKTGRAVVLKLPPFHFQKFAACLRALADRSPADYRIDQCELRQVTAVRGSAGKLIAIELRQ